MSTPAFLLVAVIRLVNSLDIRHDWMDARFIKAHSAQMIIRRHRNLVDTRAFGSRLETIRHDRLQYQINSITFEREVQCRCACISIYLPTYLPTTEQVRARAFIPAHTPRGVCGLRRLTIRDAGIYGRGVHADCRNGASAIK